MPLAKGSSQAVISSNIGELINAGHPPKQAAAIAYKTAREDDAGMHPLSDKIGRTQSVTPEGYLLCEGVRIARTGPMLYRNAEIPEIEAGDNGAITVTRDPDVLFSAETISSFVGKPVTNDHPDDLVSPESWKKLAVGTVLNVRRGDGLDENYLLADLLITDAGCIKDIQQGKREVSCGYESEAETIKPGLGRITHIIGNHVALVDRGRCGPACAINDGDPTMALKAKRSVWDRLVTAFKAGDEDAFTEELEAAKSESESGDENENHIHIHLPGNEASEEEKVEDAEEQTDDPTEERFAKIEAVLADLVKKVGDMLEAEKSEAASHEELLTDEGEGEVTPEDEEKKDATEEGEKNPVMDSASLISDWKSVVSGAEIIAPGLKSPKFDAKSPHKYTADAMCVLRRKALTAALADEAMRPMIEAIAGKSPNVKKMTCDAAAFAFNGAVELVKANNKAKIGHPEVPFFDGPMTAAKLDALNKSRRNK